MFSQFKGERRATGAIHVAALLLAISGCSGDRATGVPEDPASRLRAELGAPAAVLIVTGQQGGTLEPCGCSRGKAGGLVRRSNLVRRLREGGCPAAVVDLGGLIADPRQSPGGIGQSEIKLRYALRALDLMDYGAVVPGVDELRIGAGRALELYRDALGPETQVVAANVRFDDPRGSVVRPGVVLEAGRLRLGVTAVVAPEALEGPADADRGALLPSIRSPDEALPDVLADLESRSDQQILLVHGPFELAARLASRFPGFEIVVAASEEDAPRSRHPDILNDGRTTLATVGRKGLYAGIFAFHEDPKQRPRFRIIVLDDRYDGPGPSMSTLIRDEYRGALRAAGVVEHAPRQPDPGASYLGAASCRSCHPNTYEKWSETGHARAFDALLKDARPDVAFDAECVSCHTTGFGFESGWRSRTSTPQLAGNQCENCHGPGSRHVDDPDDREARAALHRSIVQEGDKPCLRCHDHDNSPDFDLRSYWGRIAHVGLDRYDDPKTHRRASAP